MIRCEIWSNDNIPARQCQLEKRHEGMCLFDPPMSEKDWNTVPPVSRYIPTAEETERMAQ